MEQTNIVSKIRVVEPSKPKAICLKTDFICLSHLRWDFVFQRPQHLLTRFANHRRLFYFEEPIFEVGIHPHLNISQRSNKLMIVTPKLPEGTDRQVAFEMQRLLIDELIQGQKIIDYTIWYYTPMALTFSRHLQPARVVYDCMDELSHFKFAPPDLLPLESELLERADLVFTGGHSLYEFKRNHHHNIHPCPSSIDFAHFNKARLDLEDPEDQKHLSGPRLGFFGVLDERADLELIEGIAKLRPNWQLILIGPVVKIDEAHLPKLANIHYLGIKPYAELPSYLAHWDVALLPFALNESTRFISPTKTPEYLAAGKPVVSTPIQDVVKPYGKKGFVHIGSTAEDFVQLSEKAMRVQTLGSGWLTEVDNFLKSGSWDETWLNMAKLEHEVMPSYTSQLKNIREGLN